MNPYQAFIADLARITQQARTAPLGGFQPLARPPVAANAPRALIFSPHPDDEVIIGGLPLRLLREAKMNVINVAVTQGSNKARQAERLKELQACCDYIGFGLMQTCEHGLEGVNLKARGQNPGQWNASVECTAAILRQEQPKVIFFPHNRDWNSSHIGTHHLVMEALAKLGADFACYCIETEFWGAMDDPNLMVESSQQEAIDLITALSFHVGEVRRNPYHVRMPAWLMDNVRRGGELVGGQGGAAPDFMFGTLYRLRLWRQGKLESVLDKGRFVPSGESVGSLFP